jgi:hypothetical protein
MVFFVYTAGPVFMDAFYPVKTRPSAILRQIVLYSLRTISLPGPAVSSIRW